MSSGTTGWIKVHRQITQWEWYSDANTFRVFFHLLLTANYEDRSWRGEVIKRGQRVYGLELLAAEVGLSVSKLRTALNNIQKTGEIANKTTSKGSIVTITNYELYQGDDKQIADKSQTDSKQFDKQTSPQIATTKEDKKLRIYSEDKSSSDTPPPPKPKKVTLEELSVSHVADWLAEKRSKGKYLKHDEDYVLEVFKDYCRAKGKKYSDFVAAYRNAFDWDRVQPKEEKTNGTQRQSPHEKLRGAWQSVIEESNQRQQNQLGQLPLPGALAFTSPQAGKELDEPY